MAATANTVWELRASGSNNGGAGFDNSYGGTDYSQQNSPQLSGTDGTSAGDTQLSSVSGGFTAAMVGNYLRVFTPGIDQGWYLITAVADANHITVQGTTAANLPASAAMTWYVGGAYLPSQSGFGVPFVAGNKLWMGPGTYAFTVNAPTVANGTALLPVEVEGYTVTRGDGGAAAVIQYTTANNNSFIVGTHNHVKHLTFDGLSQTHSTVLMSGNNSDVSHCKFINGTACQCEIAGHGNRVSFCELDGANNSGAGGGFALIIADFQTVNTVIEWNTIHHAPAALWAVADSGDGTLIQHNIIRDNGSHGIRLSCPNYHRTIQFNNIWNNAAAGIDLTTFGVQIEGIAIRYNIFGKNATYDINFEGSDQSGVPGTALWAKTLVESNAFYTTGTGRYHNLPAGTNDIALTANPFVDDTGTHNFQLNQTTGGGAACVGAVSLAFQDGVNTGTYSVGALGSNQAVSSGGAAAAGTAPVIDEVQFPPDISEGAVGGDMFVTVVVNGSTGAEQRNSDWEASRMQWDVSHGLRTPTEGRTLKAFFLCRRGKARGFRFKNWDDYEATNEILAPTGARTVQLIKTYSDGVFSVAKNIYKPQTGTVPVTLRRNGADYTTFTLDTTTGLITLIADAFFTITGITRAAAAVVTINSHTFGLGDVLYFEGVNGMTEINGLVGTVTATTTNTVTLSIDSSGFSTYTNGGTAAKYVQPNEVLDWSGEFDIPARFDTDQMKMTLTASQIREWMEIPVVELIA